MWPIRLHGGADAHADDLRQVAQEGGSAPAFDQDLVLLRNTQNFLGGVVNELAMVDPPALNERCRAFHVAQKCARLDV